MLYLFNSAFRPQYRVNVLNTLYLPVGSVNRYRYNIADHVDDSANPAKLKHQALIVFIDRHYYDPAMNQMFRFHPLRTATLLETESDAGYMHYYVQLGDFVYPSDINRFQSRFREALGAKVPHLPGNDPNERAHGAFAVDASETSVMMQYGDLGWTNLIQALSNAPDFNTAPNDRVVFAKTRLSREGETDALEPKVKGKNFYFQLIRGKSYELRVSYNFPANSIDPAASAALNIESGDNTRAVGRDNFPIATVSNNENYRFSIANSATHLDGRIVCDFSSSRGYDQGNYEHVGTDRSIPFQIKDFSTVLGSDYSIDGTLCGRLRICESGFFETRLIDG